MSNLNLLNFITFAFILSYSLLVLTNSGSIGGDFEWNNFPDWRRYRLLPINLCLLEYYDSSSLSIIKSRFSKRPDSTLLESKSAGLKLEVSTDAIN